MGWSLEFNHKLSSYFSLLLLVLLHTSFRLAFSGSVVKYLPGYKGQLPFHLETGYISVHDSELFYYFIESQGDPTEDPLMLWLTGGPGCSGFSGLIYEIGPMQFDINHYPGGLPSLIPWDEAWTKTASIIFVDSPVGTGFSYSRTQAGWPTSDTIASEQVYQFLVKWLLENPKYLPHELIIGGDSYAGIFVPMVTKKVLERNIAGAQPSFNLKGYVLGSPTTDEALNSNSKIVFAHRMALISDELYESMRVSCNGTYINVEPSNVECTEALVAYNLLIQGVWRNDILEVKCQNQSPRYPEKVSALRRFLTKNSGNNLPIEYPDQNLQHDRCRNYNYTLAFIWANDPRVIEALHIRKGSVTQWNRCNESFAYTQNVDSVIPEHKYLVKHDLNVLVQTGDRDMVVPHVATRAWVQELDLDVDSNWRPWFVDGQVAGYTEKYESDASGYRLVYATVKGAGHTAPEYYRKKCYHMFNSFDILEPNCALTSPRDPEKISAARRFRRKNSENNFLVGSPDGNLHRDRCRPFNYTLSNIWSNDPRVIEALHIRKGTVTQWSRCNHSLSFTEDVDSVIPVHKYLTKHDLNVLVTNGDRDMVVPHVATRAWVQELDLDVSLNWRPWFVDGQVAGYTEKYGYDAVGYSLVYATVKGAGHPAAESYRKACYHMFDRWIHTYPL